MKNIELSHLLESIKSIKIAVIGDFAVDFYFQKQLVTGEISIETNKEVFWAKEPKSSLGGAGNVCKNLANLGIQAHAFGIIGNDLFGREMYHLCQKSGINSQYLRQHDHIDTATYSKPMFEGVELNRIDFGTQQKDIETEKNILIEALIQQLRAFDFVIINEQFLYPLLTQKELIQLQKGLLQKNIPAIADLRSLGKSANDVILKVNEHEFISLFSLDKSILQDPKQLEIEVKRCLPNRSKGILLTLGEQGLLYADHENFHWQKSLPLHGPIDTVGAGDMVVAAFTAARATGASIPLSCDFATICANISIHKIGETGSASPEEIIYLNLENNE
ncbi:bifunctional heptose 7-phosphate kinase/heptose 1-phosphate adenyltransferase [Aquirufa sp. ROCK2-A2]